MYVGDTIRAPKHYLVVLLRLFLLGLIFMLDVETSSCYIDTVTMQTSQLTCQFLTHVIEIIDYFVFKNLTAGQPIEIRRRIGSHSVQW